MQRTERLNAILEQVGVSGRVDVGGLASQLGVSGATVRRDLQALSRRQLLVRTHGGAVSQQSDAEVPAGVKAVLRQPEKRRIARAAAGLVGEGSVVGLTGGSTTLELARVLLDRRGLTVVTNSLDVASELAGKPGLRLVMIGGIVRRSRELVGPAAETMLANYHLDLAVIGVDGLSAEGCTTYDEMEATTDPAKIKAGSNKLIDVWMTDFPVIALNYAPARLVYRNATTTGWPTEEKPYALDNMLYVITQIRPK